MHLLFVRLSRLELAQTRCRQDGHVRQPSTDTSSGLLDLVESLCDFPLTARTVALSPPAKSCVRKCWHLNLPQGLAAHREGWHLNDWSRSNRRARSHGRPSQSQRQSRSRSRSRMGQCGFRLHRSEPSEWCPLFCWVRTMTCSHARLQRTCVGTCTAIGRQWSAQCSARR